MEPKELVRQLVERIERYPQTLHRYNAIYDCCGRLRQGKGLAFSTPDDCDCGLDKLLAQAREFTGDSPSSIPAQFYKAHSVPPAYRRKRR
jgi:hypothetical protein